MSANVEDEARARLDVAQLYEDMGQLPKAVRYYLEAAQIYKEGGNPARHRELCNKILKLDPANVQAEAELAEARSAAGVDAPPPAPPPPPPSASGVAAPAPKPRPTGANQLAPLQLPQPQPGKVLVPTPWLFRDPRYVQSAKKQLTKPLDRATLDFDHLPKVDPQMVMIKQEQRKKADDEAARKLNPRVESAFGRGESRFGSAASPFGKSTSAAPAAAPVAGQPAPAAKFTGGGGRSGNQELAEQIRLRVQEKGGKHPPR